MDAHYWLLVGGIGIEAVIGAIIVWYASTKSSVIHSRIDEVEKRIEDLVGNAVYQELISFVEAQIPKLGGLLGEKYQPVYDCLMKSFNAVLAGTATGDEAINIANDVFKTSLGFANVALTNEQMTVAQDVIDTVVRLICKNKLGATKALTA